MEPEAAGEKLLSLQEILGMTAEDADRLIKEFGQMFHVCENPVDLCKIIESDLEDITGCVEDLRRAVVE